MIFEFINWQIRLIEEHYHNGRINLSPSYQRGDIWSLPAKKRLIETINKRYPLPAFFLFQKPDGNWDMVDGQQRVRTILGYLSNLFPDADRHNFSRNEDIPFLDYELPIVMITAVESEGEIEDFYYRVNKFGTKLNRPEINKSQYAGKPLQILIQNLADNPVFVSLGIFSQTHLNRLQDEDLISELVTYLQFGLTDKKITSDRFLQQETFTEEDAAQLEGQFIEVLTKIEDFNRISPLSQTRYRQRNDFFTLFNFTKANEHLDLEILEEFYKVLVAIGPDISPTNDDCPPLQDYAINCVSQSNSRRAREERLTFFVELLLNNDSSNLTYTIGEVLSYYDLTTENLLQVDEFLIPDYHLINS